MRCLFIALLFVTLSHAQPQPCPEGQVWCKGTEPVECIPESYECDFEYFDCSNNWDEDEHCPCRPGEYTCADGECIWGLERDCNGYRECSDGSDEMNCTTCRVFQCDDGSCLSDYYVCDGRDDCPNGEDEQPGCPKCDPRTMFTCEDLSCIFKFQLCDGYVDCQPEGSDELDCATCSPRAFQCDDGRCISEEQICDGKDDCPNGEEEEPGCPICDRFEFRCGDGSKCIGGVLQCDGVDDCSDGTDEMNCEFCRTWQCDDGSCITFDEFCDGKNDCPGGEDEEPDCVKCHPREFECEDRSKCIWRFQKCDGFVDCPDGSDEKNCSLARRQIFASNVSEQEIVGARRDLHRSVASVNQKHADRKSYESSYSFARAIGRPRKH